MMTMTALELDDDISEGLERLAKRTGKKPTELAGDAVRSYVSYEIELQRSIDAGLTDIAAGRTKTTEEMMASLGVEMPERSE